MHTRGELLEPLLIWPRGCIRNSLLVYAHPPGVLVDVVRCLPTIAVGNTTVKGLAECEPAARHVITVLPAAIAPDGCIGGSTRGLTHRVAG